MTDQRGARPRVPAHVVIMLGASTVGYSVILAGIGALQSGSEALVAVARQPALSAVGAASAANDALEERLDGARRRYAELVAVYDAVTKDLDGESEYLQALAAEVTRIDGVSRSLPSAVRLPPVRSSVPGTRAPATHTTTRASGG